MRKKTGRLIQKRTNPAPFYIPYLTKLHLMSTNREVLTTIITEIKVTWFITFRTFGINWSTQLFPALFLYSSNILNSLDCFDDAGAPNENIVQNHLNIALLNVF